VHLASIAKAELKEQAAQRAERSVKWPPSQ